MADDARSDDASSSSSSHPFPRPIVLVIVVVIAWLVELAIGALQHGNAVTTGSIADALPAQTASAASSYQAFLARGHRATQPFVPGACATTPTATKAAVILPPPTNTATPILVAQGTGSGILSGLWISTGTGWSGSAVGLQIYIDGELCVGNTSGTFVTLDTGNAPWGTQPLSQYTAVAGTSNVVTPAPYSDGINTLALTLDRWANAGTYVPRIGVVYANDFMGSNALDQATSSGYVFLDAPFSSSYAIYLNSLQPAGGYGTNAQQQYWLQPFVSQIPPALNPYGALKLRACTFQYQAPAYGDVMPLMSFQGKQGVYLKCVKFSMLTTDATGAALQGRWGVWASPATLTQKTSWATGQQYAAGNLVAPMPSGSLVFNSTGLDDFLLATNGLEHVSANTGAQTQGTLYPLDSSQWTSGPPQPTFYTKLSNEAGVLVNTAFPASLAATSGAYFAGYRAFGMRTGVCPYVPGTQAMTLTWTCGDQLTGKGSGAGGCANFMGVVFFYA